MTGKIAVKTALYFLLLLTSFPSIGSESENLETDLNLYELPLEELLKVIISASKIEESLFDAPVAAHVLTHDEIARAGANSIPEALRLIPGLIVREQTNGNYDVHIRGLDNIPPSSQVVRTSHNNLTLVMIDNRTVYNHYTGGIFWEQLPITINDIERIEVVKGTSSSMYGPNAVTGVIHILTKQTLREAVSINIQQGNHHTGIYKASANFALGQFKSRISAHWQERDRYENAYFEFLRGEYIATPNEIQTLPFSPGGPLPDADIKYPHPSRALSREGVNFYLQDVQGSLHGKLSAGYQQSFAQKVYDDNSATPLTSIEAHSSYLNLQANWQEKLSSRFQIEEGSSTTLGSPFFSYRYRNEQFIIDGKYTRGDILLQPLFHYSRQQYDGDGFSGKAEMEHYSLGIRSEYKQNKWRYTSSFRSEHYNCTENSKYSYLLGIAYQARENLHLRASHGHATQEPFMLHIFADFQFPNTDISIRGNHHIELVEANNLEFGLRWQIDNTQNFDLEAFGYNSKNYQAPVSDDLITFSYQNLPDRGRLRGITANYEYEEKSWNFAIFLTGQKTTLRKALTTENKHTPAYYGGLSLNYSGINAWNLNLSAYFFGKHIQFNAKTFDQNEPDPLKTLIAEAKTPSRFIMSSKVNYQASPYLSIFANLRNFIGDGKREFAMTDRTRTSYLLGVDISI